MTIQEAIELFKKHQSVTVRKNTIKSYGKFLEKFDERFSQQEVVSVSADDISKFLEEYTDSLHRSTCHLRYTQMKAFFNYVIEASDLNIKNPCNAGVLCKTFKNVHQRPRKILDKETVDEIIFNSRSVRDRLILELQARCGLRIGKSSTFEPLMSQAENCSSRNRSLEGMQRLPSCRNTLPPDWPSIFKRGRCLLHIGCFLSAIPRSGIW